MRRLLFLYVNIFLQVVLVLIGSNYSFVENILLSTELTIKNLVFMFGQKFKISVTATNSVGESDSFQSNFTVNDKTGKRFSVW